MEREKKVDKKNEEMQNRKTGQLRTAMRRKGENVVEREREKQ